jgi:hypothetical protein
MTKRNQYDDDDNPDIVKDGEKISVPIYLLDSMQRSVAAHYGRRDQIVDAFGMSAGRKRGYCFQNTSSVLQDAASDTRQAAFDALEKRSQSAWRRTVDGLSSATLRTHAARLHGAASDLEGKIAEDEEGDNEEADIRTKAASADSGGQAAIRDAALAALIERSKNAWRS